MLSCGELAGKRTSAEGEVDRNAKGGASTDDEVTPVEEQKNKGIRKIMHEYEAIVSGKNKQD